MVFLDNLITNVKQTSTNTLNYLKNGINSGVLKIENILDNDKKSIIRRKENFEQRKFLQSPSFHNFYKVYFIKYGGVIFEKNREILT